MKLSTPFIGIITLIGSIYLLTDSYLDLLEKENQISELRETIRKDKVKIAIHKNMSKVDVASPTENKASIKPPLKLVLLGTVITPDDQLALIQTKDGLIYRLRLNDHVENARLVKLSPYDVMFDHEGSMLSVPLENELHVTKTPDSKDINLKQSYLPKATQTSPSLAEISSNPFFNTPFKGM